ncbi:hypothetical protein LNV09_00495 [Paucibacter sp. B2R-40]|uniref:hypothetical protein n=1 Tax=Paucibacter sp. B2R-40 TaxID=2893554 RepID=UPI0021E443FC|nr:hypothetical protein [Paucibacter sp. B2R-40]MCV2352632.1 hypothetical protein [Paucibacter sp. B2R-40]
MGTLQPAAMGMNVPWPFEYSVCHPWSKNSAALQSFRLPFLSTEPCWYGHRRNGGVSAQVITSPEPDGIRVLTQNGATFRSQDTIRRQQFMCRISPDSPVRCINRVLTHVFGTFVGSWPLNAHLAQKQVRSPKEWGRFGASHYLGTFVSQDTIRRLQLMCRISPDSPVRCINRVLTHVFGTFVGSWPLNAYLAQKQVRSPKEWGRFGASHYLGTFVSQDTIRRLQLMCRISPDSPVRCINRVLTHVFGTFVGSWPLNAHLAQKQVRSPKEWGRFGASHYLA